MSEDLKKMYKTIMDDHFPESMTISFSSRKGGDQTLVYEKVSWVIEGVKKGLRYGENPGQEAAFYKLINGNLTLGETTMLKPGRYLMSDAELLQSGKHPGKTNITDVDNALNILRYLTERPAVVIVKHNNPCGCGVALSLDGTLENAYNRANMADRVAAFGGAIVLNRPVDRATAEAIAACYAEVVAAPEYEEGSFGILAARKNLRIVRIDNIKRLQEYAGQRVVDFKSLIDGGIIVQWSFVPTLALDPKSITLAETQYKGKTYKVGREPTPKEMEDLKFGWLVEAGVTSNSVLYVKDLCTVGIGTGEQDRVGVAEIARDKAYRKLADRICFEMLGIPSNKLEELVEQKQKGIQREETDEKAREISAKFDMGELQRWRADISQKVGEQNGGIKGAVMVSDAFFPFRDGIDVGLREGVTAVIQPGGSDRDFEVIEACNEYGATMVFTGQRSFKH